MDITSFGQAEKQIDKISFMLLVQVHVPLRNLTLSICYNVCVIMSQMSLKHFTDVVHR